LFNLLPGLIKKGFSYGTFDRDLGNGHFGHRCSQKVGPLAACADVTESSSHLDHEVIKNNWCLFDKIEAAIYVWRVTSHTEYYCTKFLLESAITEYNKRRESRVATLVMQEMLNWTM
jgi:hypothetical protein